MADTTLPLSHLRARLAAPRGKRRMDALLSADDPGEAVATLSSTEVYQLVHEVGFGEATELLALATPEQVRGCLDLDAWDRDHLRVEAITPWLSALAEAGYEKLGEVWEKLDPEFTALILARSARIFDLTLDEEPDEGDDEGGRPVILTPDTFFAVQITAEDTESARLVQQIIDHLYRADPSGALARHTLMAARSEPPAELEEMSYRWRSGRMADMGYVEFHEALEVYRPLDASAVAIGEGTEDRFGSGADAGTSPGVLPVPIAERVVGRSFLARALDLVDLVDVAQQGREPAQPGAPAGQGGELGGEIDRLEMAMAVLVNKVLAAARVSPGNREAVEVGAEHATATLALGLEVVSQGDLERAARALRTISFTRLHRVGYTVTIKLARLARSLAPRVVTAGESTNALMSALCNPRPFFPRELDRPPGAGVRPFESLDDVRVVAEELTRLTLRVAIASALGVDLLAMAHKPEPRPALDDHVRTALVHAMLGPGFSATPLTTGDLARLRDVAFVQGELEMAARHRATQALLAHLDSAAITAARDHLPELVVGWFRDIEDSLGPLPPDPDPRFIAGVLVAARHA